MSGARDKAAALMDIALETYADEIAPELRTDKRYTSAMVANALNIARRRLDNPDPGAILIESLGAESMEVLAREIRSGEITGTSEKNLAAKLLDYVEAELAITNPKFLKRRKG